MENSKLIEEIVENAFQNLKAVSKYNLFITGSYINIILPENKIKEVKNDEKTIINKTFIKICNEINEYKFNKNLNEKSLKSFCFNNPTKNLKNKCFNLVTDILNNKIKNLNIFELIDTLKLEEKDLEKSFDTIFDILLNYLN